MEYTQLLTERRSIRRYTDQPVPLETITELIRESTLAPSASNTQPWKFIIVNDREFIDRIAAESRQNLLSHIKAHPESYVVRYEKMLRKEGYNVFFNAPSLVMILGPTDYPDLYVDCALYASYFMNGAAARGLGTCWVNLGRYIEDPDLVAELAIPADCTLVAPITIGYPVAIPKAPPRKDPEIIQVIDAG